jgi:hypothetical protein
VTNTKFSSAAISELSRPIEERVVRQISGDLSVSMNALIARRGDTCASLLIHMEIEATIWSLSSIQRLRLWVPSFLTRSRKMASTKKSSF